jgi:hypothetical protein
MSAPSKLLGGPPDELIDLMPPLPRMRTDLSNGKRLAATHGRELRGAGYSGPAAVAAVRVCVRSSEQ